MRVLYFSELGYKLAELWDNWGKLEVCFDRNLP
jgi:hypothetical protein